MEEPKATILIVDDQPENLEILAAVLKADYRVRAVRSGAGAFRAAGLDPRPDLILLDIMMPGMDGFETLSRLREDPELSKIPVIFVTARTATEDEEQGFDLGAVDYITKPIRPAVVLARVRAHLELKRSRDLLADQNAVLEARVRERTAALEQANQALHASNERLHQNFLVTIKIFSNFIEMRQKGSGGHARRVAGYAQKLTSHMGLDAKTQQDILIAALLHDIGKIGFGDNLFGKPFSKMNAQEIAVYEGHPQVGATALMPLADLQNIAPLIQSHHECYDGQGFPDGLSGKDIPLGARILAVANDLDALQQGTQFGRLHATDEALGVIRELRGQRYDPDVVDALVDLMGRQKKEARPSAQYVEVPVAGLQAGMVLARDLLDDSGTLLLSADYVLDENLVKGIKRYALGKDLRLTAHVRSA